MNTLIGYRKVIMGVFLVGLGIGLDRWFGLSNNLLELIKFVTISFFIGNGVEHVTNAVVAVKGDLDGDGDVDERDAQIDEISNKIVNVSSQVEQVRTQVTESQGALVTIQQAIAFIMDKAGYGKR